MMRVLFVVAVEREAVAVRAALDALDAVGIGADVVTAGVGRVNAAVATALARDAIDATGLIVSTGIAGALPSSGLAIGDVVVAEVCVYAEEGLATPEGFEDMARLGFPLGDFVGNRVPVDEGALGALRRRFRCGPIATVATCSGSDAAAAEVVRRTGAIAEAMEGAAVVHAARRIGRRAIELRSISNTTGDRSRQRWEIDRALEALRDAIIDQAKVLAELV